MGEHRELSKDWEEKLMKKTVCSNDLDDFENFVRRIDELSSILNGTGALENGSEDATSTAGSCKQIRCEAKAKNLSLPTETGSLKKRCNAKGLNKTIINRNIENSSQNNLTNLNVESMPQEAFMRIVEEDANKRARERVERKKQADHLKVQGNEAFRNGRFEKALSFYNQAIDIRRDSCMLYTNRAVTLLKLGLFTRAVNDCDSALKLKECLKPRLYKGRALFEMGKEEESQTWMKETKDIYSSRTYTIQDYENEWQKNK